MLGAKLAPSTSHSTATPGSCAAQRHEGCCLAKQREMTASSFTAKSKAVAGTSSDLTVKCPVCEEGESGETLMASKLTLTREQWLTGN